MSGISIRVDLRKLKKMQRKSPQVFDLAMQRGALQFLTWCNNGSPRETRTPPIKWGVLKGSSSTFVGSKLVSVWKAAMATDTTPLEAYSGADGTITWVWNTNYAARMHEHTGNWGEVTQQSPDAGNKWLEKHLIADRNALWEVVAAEFKRESGL